MPDLEKQRQIETQILEERNIIDGNKILIDKFSNKINNRINNIWKI